MIIYIFSISLMVFEIIGKKNVFEKSLSGARRRKKSRLGSKHVQSISPNWESRVSPGQHNRGNISPKLGVGVFF